MKTPIITLLTDFGHLDPFVGIMKGVILSVCPAARLVDLTHEVPPQAVLSAAYLLRSSIDHFPKGTVHLCVVDPGVGSSRKPVAMASKGHYFVGPDNGLFSAALKDRGIDQVVELTEKKYQLADPSTTFHGRDIFAPVAAHLAKGTSFARLGNRINHWVWRELPRPFKGKNGWIGEVLWIDRFGNLITNFTPGMLPKPFRMRIGKAVILDRADHYARIKRGSLAVLVGSTGNLEVSINGGSAAQKLAARIGTDIYLA